MPRRLLEYPAYARTIAAHVVRGQKPMAVAVLLSANWSYYDHLPKLCIRPEDWSVWRYEFGYLRGLHVIVVPAEGCADQQLGELVLELMCSAPRLLWAWNVDGSKLYDGDDPLALGDWLRQLAKLPAPSITVAQHAMLRAQSQEAERWNIESQRILEKSGVEAYTNFFAAGERQKDRVRALLSSPWQAPGDARAA